MKKINMVLAAVLMGLVTIAGAAAFTDINSPQYYGKINIPKTHAAIDANFALIEAGTDSATLATDNIFVGNDSSNRTAMAVAGDVTITQDGTNATTAIAAGVVVNADVNASAAIVGSKLDLTSGTGAATIGGAFAAQMGVTFADTNNVAREFRVSNDYRHVITPNALGAQANAAEIAVVSSFNTISAAGAVTNTVATPYTVGQLVTIINTGSQPITFETGGNIKSAEIVLTENDAMQLYSADGTNWWLIATIVTP